MSGTNLNSATNPVTQTLWIREVEPIPTGTGDIALAISATCIGTPPTIINTFKHGCLMLRMDTSTGTEALYQNIGSASAVDWTILATFSGGPATSLVDTNQVTALDVGTTASAVNNFRVTDSATTGAPDLSSVGSDTNIGQTYTPKGSGVYSIKGTGRKTVQQTWNYIASETGANNAIVGALVDANGTAVPLAAGLRVIIKLGHTLQAGANTFNLNGGGAVAIKSHFNVANDIATAYAATGVITLFYDGTRWLDMAE